jgi:putative membrane protein
MLWVKAFHIVFMVTWFAGLFYLPRLFVYHAMTDDTAGNERFKVMERRLFYGIMTPGAVITIVLGLWLWLGYGIGGTWMHLKLGLVIVLVVYHLYCGKLLLDFKRDRRRHRHVFYRWLNEFPVLLLIAIVVLVVVKPSLAHAQTTGARIALQGSPLARQLDHGAGLAARVDKVQLIRAPNRRIEFEVYVPVGREQGQGNRIQ